MLFPISVVPFEAIRDWECFDADAGKDSARGSRVLRAGFQQLEGPRHLCEGVRDPGAEPESGRLAGCVGANEWARLV